MATTPSSSDAPSPLSRTRPPPPPHAARSPIKELLIDSLSGTVGGIMGIIIGAPFDLVKTRMQQLGASYGGVLDCVRTTARAEGVPAFFKGALAASIGQAPNNFVVFGAAGGGRRLAERWEVGARLGLTTAAARDAAHVFIAGGLAGALQSVALGPFEHVKVQQQVTRGGSVGLIECTRGLLAAGGAPLLFRGTTATLIRDVVPYGFYFLAYEWLKEALVAQAGMVGGAGTVTAGGGAGGSGAAGPPPAWAVIVAGALAGQLSWLLALPADVVKSNIQSSAPDVPLRDTRFMPVARRLHAAHGRAVFWRGLMPCLVRAAPVNAATFTGYEWARAALTSGGGDEGMRQQAHGAVA